MMDIRESHNRLGTATTYGRRDDEELLGGRGAKTESQLAMRKEQRKRYQFESNASDDEVEDELDDNLDEISAMTKRLKALGTAMGQELENQNARIERIDGKTVGLDSRIFRNTERVNYSALKGGTRIHIFSYSSRKFSWKQYKLNVKQQVMLRICCSVYPYLILYKNTVM